MTHQTRRQKKPNGNLPNRWSLQNAKAHFSEVVRRAGVKGAQHVTVRGREEVVILSTKEFRRLKGDETGKALIAALKASPHADINLEARRAAMPVRDVNL